MIINSTVMKFDSMAYELSKHKPRLRFIPYNTASGSLRFNEESTKLFFSDVFLRLRKEKDISKKIDIVDDGAVNFCRQFEKLSKFFNYSKAENEFQGSRSHEICDNFVGGLRLRGELLKYGELEMTPKEYEFEVLNTAKGILNSLRRYELLRQKGVDGSLIKPREIFDMSLGFGADFSKKYGVKFKTDGTEILDSYKNGIFIKCESGVIRIKDSKLLEVVSNLIQNAGKYSKDNSTVKIDISELKENGKTFLTLSVKDEGIGFPKDIIENLSQERAQNAIDYAKPGKGYGLNKIKKLIEAAGAKFEINSPLYPNRKDFPGSEVKITAEVLKN